MPDSIQSLLDRDLPPDYRREATEHIAAESAAAVVKTESALIFRIHTEWLALSTMVFQGIAPTGVVHSLPHRRNGILLGLTPVRGELLICISLGELLGVTAVATPSAADRRAQGRGGERLIVRGVGGLLVFPVHEVHGVHRYRPEDLREIPATLAHAATRYTVGMLPWNGRLVARLDDALIFHAVSRVLS